MAAIPHALDLIGIQLIVIAVPLLILAALGSVSLAVYVVKRIRQ